MTNISTGYAIMGKPGKKRRLVDGNLFHSSFIICPGDYTDDLDMAFGAEVVRPVAEQLSAICKQRHAGLQSEIDGEQCAGPGLIHFQICVLAKSCFMDSFQMGWSPGFDV